MRPSAANFRLTTKTELIRLKQARKRMQHLEKLQRDDEQEERLFERHLDQKEEKEKNELDEVHRKMLITQKLERFWLKFLAQNVAEILLYKGYLYVPLEF